MLELRLDVKLSSTGLSGGHGSKSKDREIPRYGLEISRAVIPRQIRFSLLVLHCSAVTPVGAFNYHRSCNGIYQSIWFSPVAVSGFRLRSRELRVTMYRTTLLYVATLVLYSPAPWGTLGHGTGS